MTRPILHVVAGWAAVLLFSSALGHVQAIGHASPSSLVAQSPVQGAIAPQAAAPQRDLLNQYCVACHNQRLQSGNFALDSLDVTNVGANPVAWEKVVRKMRAGLMPPAGRPRPDDGA